VMESDHIDTGKNSSASLLLPGRMISVESGPSVVYHDGNVVPNTSVAKLGSASAMAHDSDTEGQGDRNEKGKQKCLSASGNKKCVCHKKTEDVDVCEIED